jgi:hypothetical protein
VLWTISAYFNPAGYRTRLANFREFRDQLDAPLVVVEAASDGRFELGPQDAEVVVQIPEAAVLWQKERLLNVALRQLPPECRYVAWVDCDVVFDSHDWDARAVAALRTHRIVQLFSERQNLGPEGRVQLSVEAVARRLAKGTATAADLHDPLAQMQQGSTAGLAWAAHREALEECGFYDACILGSGDRSMMCAAVGELEHGVNSIDMTPRHAEHYRRWGARFAEAMGGRIGVVEGRLVHLWHGDLEDRRYATRYRGLRHFGFDPFEDIALAPNGSWAWNTDKPEMHAYVRDYFASRREDGE